jgi:hypothetical protein
VTNEKKGVGLTADQKGKAMKLVETILRRARAIVKARRARRWLRRERRALETLAESWRHISAAERYHALVRSMRPPAHSDALHKAPIVQVPPPEPRRCERLRAWVSTADRN